MEVDGPGWQGCSTTPCPSVAVAGLLPGSVGTKSRPVMECGLGRRWGCLPSWDLAGTSLPRKTSSWGELGGAGHCWSCLPSWDLNLGFVAPEGKQLPVPQLGGAGRWDAGFPASFGYLVLAPAAIGWDTPLLFFPSFLSYFCFYKKTETSHSFPPTPQDWAMPEPAARSYIWVFHGGSRDFSSLPHLRPPRPCPGRMEWAASSRATGSEMGGLCSLLCPCSPAWSARFSHL